MLRDATPEDIALASSNSLQSGFSESSSEIERLRKMPGFGRLEKQIFFNLMTAQRQANDNNVRVSSVIHKDSSASELNGARPEINTKVRMLIGSPDQNNEESVIGSSDSDADLSARGDIAKTLNSTIDGGDYVDRVKLKEISQLIIDRDAAKFGYLHLKLNEKKEPARKMYKPKFIEIK